MGDFLDAHVDTYPHNLAVIDDRPGAEVVAWTFGELSRRANQLAAHFRELGANRRTKIVFCGQNSAALMTALHAIRRIGAVGVPLNYRLAAEEAAYVIDNSDATIVYLDAAYSDLIEAVAPATPKVAHRLVFAGDGSLERHLATLPDTEPAPEGSGDGEPGVGIGGGSTMIYTSGTTGKPKGAVRSAERNPTAVTELVKLIGYVPDDVYITTGPLYHSGPLGFAAIAHLLGNTVVLQHKFDPEDWLRLVQTYGVTTSFTAPTPIRMICTLPPEVKARYDRSSIKRMIANAAPWTLALKRMYVDNFPPDSLWEVYGSTELGVDTVLGPDEHFRKPGSCGRPAPQIEIKLFADDGTEITEPHVPGELYVRSESMFDTYYKAEDKYDEDRRGDYHTVGDIAYRDEDGYYYIADRKKDMIISGGMNIYPAEIEAALDGSPDIYEVAVFGIPSEEWGETVHAVVVPARPDVTEADIVAFARQHLASYRVPRSVSFVEELPKTGSGKVLKRELRAPFWADQLRSV